jgi:hypothetical protein
MNEDFFDIYPQKFYLLSVKCRRLMTFESADRSLEQAVEEAFGKLSRTVGGNVHAEYVYEPSMLEVMNELSEKWKSKYPSIQQLPAFLRQLKEGDLFIRHQAWAPLPDLKRSLATLKSVSLDIDPRKYDTYFVLNWGRLYLLFDTYSYGFLTDKIYVGEDVADKRICRFCGRAGQKHFTKEAHAIMDALGNKLLFCNEECDTCNQDFERLVERHLYKFLEINRTLSNVSGKGSRNHHLEGMNFHIHPDPKTLLPVVYVKQEHVINVMYNGKPTGKIRLFNKGQINFNGIYKSLVKIAVDMLPSDRLPYFKRTCKWVHGDIDGSHFQPFYYGEHNDFFEQPVLDLFFRNEHSPITAPFCTAILYIFDSIFLYTLPFCDMDGNMLDGTVSLSTHWNLFKRYQYLSVQEWAEYDTNNRELLSPIYDLFIFPQNEKYSVEFRASTDDVFKIKR